MTDQPGQLPPNAPIDDDELVPADDAIIGIAFRWSLVVFIFIGLGIGGIVWKLKRPAARTPAVQAQYVPAQVLAAAAAPPAVKFTDITASAGIDFVHENGATGDKLLPETMGGGCAFLDYDNDGDQDILFVNSTFWPDHRPQDQPPPTMALYRNDGRGRFDNVTAESGLNVSFYGMGVAMGDYDGDGDSDLFFTAVGPDHLFRNNGGKFEDATASAGLGGDPGAWSTAAGFFDFDNDGDLDLFVCNYVKWSREIDFAVDFKLLGVGRAYGQPTTFEGTHSHLYRNDGDGTFADVSAAAGIQVNNPATGSPVGKALAVAPIDLDRDGYVDLLVANDTTQNFLFHNQRDGTFKEIGAAAGVAFDSMGNATGAMGTDCADYRNENVIGCGIGNFANEMTSLYLAQDDPLQFVDVAIVEGVGGPSRQYLKFGLFFFDYDLDGRLDLLHCNGHLEDEINKVQPSQHYQQPAQLFWNALGGIPDQPGGMPKRSAGMSVPQDKCCFVEVPPDPLGDFTRPIVGRGATYADIDADGDLDVLLTQVGGKPMLLRNDQTLDHHWLRVKLVGTGPNRDAIGAWIELEAGGIKQRRQVMPTRSYLTQVELPVTFGLGAHDKIDSLRVTWPDGVTQDFAPGPIDRTIILENR